MKPRWVDDDRTIKGDRVGYTVIAKWRPWLYYLVCTFRVDGSSKLQRMISSLDTGLPLESATVRADYFATRVVHCSRFGVASPTAKPLLEREYDTFDEARTGHAEAVATFGSGYDTNASNKSLQPTAGRSDK